jgi:hypothetical protein
MLTEKGDFEPQMNADEHESLFALPAFICG